MNKTPYSRQHIDQNDVLVVCKAMTCPILTGGSGAQLFEQALSDRLNDLDVCVVSSGTAALHLLYMKMKHDFPDLNKVIVPAITFAATANAAIVSGLEVLIADVTMDGLIDPNSVERLLHLHDDVCAIVGVDYAGQRAPYAELSHLKGRFGVPFLVADAAHSFGVSDMMRDVDYACLSFHPVKTITTIEGGAIVTRLGDSDWFRVMRQGGVNRQGHEDWEYGIEQPGLNYRMSDVQCALGLSQLGKVDHILQRRQHVANIYRDGLRGLQLIADGRPSANHLFPVHLKDSEQRREAYRCLMSMGYGVQVHYQPLTNFKPYAGQYYDCMGAQNFYAGVLSLPCHTDLSEEHQQAVIVYINNLVSR